jgi:hypothetical protein
LVIVGNTSARAAASRRPAELAITPWTLKAPKADANISGTSTIAKTFHPTGQLLSDQAGGRFAGSAPLAGSPVNAGGTASTWLVGRVNIVTVPRPRGRPPH